MDCFIWTIVATKRNIRTLFMLTTVVAKKNVKFGLFPSDCCFREKRSIWTVSMWTVVVPKCKIWTVCILAAVSTKKMIFECFHVECYWRNKNKYLDCFHVDIGNCEKWNILTVSTWTAVVASLLQIWLKQIRRWI